MGRTHRHQCGVRGVEPFQARSRSYKQKRGYSSEHPRLEVQIDLALAEQLLLKLLGHFLDILRWPAGDFHP
jgi:hypothetical protein